MTTDKYRLTVKMEDLISKASILLPSITTVEAWLNESTPR